MEVEIRDLQETATDHELLRRVARRALEVGGGRLDRLSVALVDDRRISQINRRFRNREGPTDVIAFEAEPEAGELAGEVIISVETARRQADEAGHGLARELCLLMAHGVLHVLGHDDETETGAAEMNRLQDTILAGLEVPSNCHDR
ncbi:MAG: rRNA maturation RNase YbeY [Armatimonadetes bacterium]|nr:rRNA maturation RNase YbeY [Armatimonadota bacterium]